MKKVNFTIELESDEEILRFEYWIKGVGVEVVDLTILPDTTKLYEDSAHFRKLCKDAKISKQIKNDFINKNK